MIRRAEEILGETRQSWTVAQYRAALLSCYIYAADTDNWAAAKAAALGIEVLNGIEGRSTSVEFLKVAGLSLQEITDGVTEL